MIPKRASRKNGLATAYALVIIFVISVLGFELASRGVLSLSQTFRVQQNEQAFYAALAGESLAVEAIKNNDPNIPNGCGVTATPVSLSGLSNPRTLSNNAAFSLKVTNNFGALCLINKSAPDGTVIPPGMIYVSSTGTDGTSTKIVNAMLGVTVGWQYPYGIFATAQSGSPPFIALNGNAYTDSYNSSNGPCIPPCTGTKGNAGTNSAVNSAMNLTGNAKINGNAAVGPGGTAGSPTISTSGGAGYNSASVMGSQISVSAITDPLGGPGNNNVSVKGVATLTPGTYGEISISGNGVLTIVCAPSPANFSVKSLLISGNGQAIVSPTCTTSNPIQMYVYNGLQLTGNGVVNTGEVSGAFVVYGMSSLATAQVSGNGTSAYVLDAPQTNVTVSGNGDIYGSIVGNSVTLTGNGGVHYDEALGNDSTIGSRQVTIESWGSP